MSLNYKKSKWKEDLIEIGKWGLFAFFIGVVLTLGGEMVKYMMPVKQPPVTIVKHIHTVSPDLKD